MEPRLGDIYCHIASGLLCLVLDDKPYTTCGAWRVQFITGNKYMNVGYVTPVNLTPKSYELLEIK